MKKFLLLLFVVIIATLSVFIFTSCVGGNSPGGDGNPPEVGGVPGDGSETLDGVILPYMEFVYDGTPKGIYVTGALPSGFTVEYSGNGESEVGSYYVTAKFYKNGVYMPSYDLNNMYSIKPVSSIDLSYLPFPNGDYTYSGDVYTTEIIGELPEGVTVEYFGGYQSEAGAYEVRAKFYYNGMYIEGQDRTAWLTIYQQTLDVNDLYDLTFGDKSVYYDGEVHSIFVGGDIPEVFDVSYSGNGQTAVGNYTVKATFTVKEEYSNNYICYDEVFLTANLTIILPPLDPSNPPDLSGVIFESYSVTYDGQPHALEVKNLPDNVTVRYYMEQYPRDYYGDNYGCTNAGSYVVSASFYYGGEPMYVDSLQASLTINPAKIEYTIEGSFEKMFDGNEFEIPKVVFSGICDGRVEANIGYNGNSSICYPGIYEIYYWFHVKDGESSNIGGADYKYVTLTIYENPEYKTEGIEYIETSEGLIVSGYSGIDEALVIPSFHDNRPVIGIASRAFDGNTVVKYAYIPASVRAIGYAAFRGVTNLESIVIPFVGGSKSSTNTHFAHIFGGESGGAVPTKLKKVVVLGSAEIIPAYSFNDCKFIKSIELRSGITTIGDIPFAGCSRLENIYIPASVIYANQITHNLVTYTSSLVIEFEADAVPSTFGEYWNGGNVNVEFGKKR